MMNKASIRIRPTIVLFGDSITEFAFGENYQVGWASLLSSLYTRRADVLSRGFSGYNTKHALGVMPSVFRMNEAGIVVDGTNKAQLHSTKISLLFCTVFLGANDASLPSARQHLPIDEYEQNMRNIILGIRKSTIAHVKNLKNNDEVPIILFTPPPVSSKAWDHYCTVTSPRPLSPRSNERSKEYGLRVKVVGEEMGCAVVDTYSLLGGDSGEIYYNKFLTDGLHLNGEGNKIIFEGLVDILKRNYSSLLPTSDSIGDQKNSSDGLPLEEKLWSELC